MLTPAEERRNTKASVGQLQGRGLSSKQPPSSFRYKFQCLSSAACSLLAVDGSETYRLGRLTLEIKQKDKVTYVISRYQIARNGHSLEITS